MAKRGRPSGFNEALKATIIRLYAEKPRTDVQVAKIIGIAVTTLRTWRGKHPDLLIAVREAKNIADDLVEASLFSRATGWKDLAPDPQSAIFWLRNRQPERWREKTEGDVNVNNTTNINGLSDDQLEARIAKLISKTAKAKEEGN